MGKDTKQPGGIPNRPYDAPKENPNNPYVRNVSIPRLKRFKAKFPHLLKENH